MESSEEPVYANQRELIDIDILEDTRKRDSFALKFPKEIEKPFLEHYFNSSFRQVRLGIFIGTILMAMFAVDDLTMEPAKKDIALKIRFLGMIPLLLSIIYITYLPIFKKYFQFIICAVSMIIGIGLIILISLHEKPIVYNHHPTIMLMIIASYTLFRLRFHYAVASQWTISLISLLSAAYITQTPSDLLGLETLRLVTINCIGMLSSYTLERYIRNTFLDACMLSVKKKQAEDATILKDKFISLAFHDLRSPVSSAISLLRLLGIKDEGNLSGKQKDIISRLIITNEWALKTIDRLFDISLLKTGKITPRFTKFNTVDLVDTMFKRIEQSAQHKGINIVNNIPYGSEIHADKHLLEDVMHNLLANSIKFCSDGDTVTVFLHEDVPTSIAVRDTGIGIDPDMISDIFKHEVKTCRKGTAGEEGTGFGLPICMDIVKAHGGRIWVESKNSEGALFCVELPKSEPNVN